MVVSTLACPIKSWTVRMSVPFWSNWVAKEWRIEWQQAFLGMSALRTATWNWRWSECSWRWCRAIAPVRGWAQTLAAAKTYCHAHSAAARG